MNNRFDYAGKYLRNYESARYSFTERNMTWLDKARRIIVLPDAEEFADVSFYQAGMDWDKYSLHARATIIRIGQNVWRDYEFEDNYAEAHARHFAVGGYWFFDGRVTPQQQANVIIDAMQGKYFEMELLIDWETSFGGAYEGLVNVVKLMQLVEAAGVKCKAAGLYTGFYWFVENSNLSANAAQYTYLKSRPLWLAWYAAAIMVKVPPPWSDWTHWQYGTPAVDWGQPTKELDMNKHNGTKAQFASRYLGETQPPTGGTMDKYMKVTDLVTNGLNIRSSGVNLGTQNDLGDFNLVRGDVIHVVESNTDYYQRFDKLYRDNVLVELVQSPTSQYWARSTDGINIWLADTVFTPPAKTIEKVNIYLAPGSTLTTVYSDGTEKVETA